MKIELLHGWARYGDEIVKEHPELRLFYEQHILPELKKMEAKSAQ